MAKHRAEGGKIEPEAKYLEGAQRKCGGKIGKRAKGGRVGVDADATNPTPDVYSGQSSEVIKRAKERKRGGKVEGKKPLHVEGAAPRYHRLDRPGRKRGGAVGADRSPLTAAAKLSPDLGGKGAYKSLDKEDD